MKTKVVVNVLLNGCQSRPSMKKCILGCLKPMVPCLFQEATCKYKVMKIAATLPGVEKVSIEEETKLLTVIGEGIDTVTLVNVLRKKVGFATIVTVGPEEEKKEEKKPADNKEEPPQQPWVYYNRVLPMGEIYEIRDPYYYNNSCFPFW
ncbi:heavy metal-associated isoprenylated plant protein 16-like [Lycium ferocissimum]|uniref:heavy metal-associated isoprenylated plant protein 16-like n=1 Tax=Lycium ferocissimum TaxID=112874 RepID=UPI0028159797|nr:heavy metal-associated isoprenylated plant protein 16-like [Lycium ferocissimum]